MKVLIIRTDNPVAEIGLFEDQTKIVYETWQADRQLAETIHVKIRDLLASQNVMLNDLQGLVVFAGPGSFTGLRIGISVANALAYGLHIPIIGMTTDNWVEQGIEKLVAGQDGKIIIPEYGSLPNITAPRK